jgi:HlyD family secretion protein/adhesin transport system membrane fusion protein
MIIRAPRSKKPLTEPTVFEEETLPGFVRTALWIGAALVIFFLVWASEVRLDEVSTGIGQVVPSAQVKVVQHLEGGVVSAIQVAEGDLVEAGQTLIRLDPTPAAAEQDEMRARYVGLLLREERLLAGLAGRRPDFARIDRSYPDLTSDQQQIWVGQVATRKSALEVLDHQVEQKRDELRQLGDMLRVAEKQQKITGDQTEIRRQGVESGVVSLQTYLETKRAEVAAEGEVLRLNEQVKVAKEAVTEIEKRRQNLNETQRQDLLSELGSVSSELEQVRSTLAKLKDRVERTDVKAPVAGYVQDLKVHTIGEVLPAGGMVAHIVPVHDQLELEVRIPPADIGHIRAGQDVKVKVAAYEYVRYGSLHGKLVRVSATTFSDEQNKPYYKGVVELDQAWMGPEQGHNPIIPGMSAEVDIVTGDKSLIQYLIKPVFISLKSSFHER